MRALRPHDQTDHGRKARLRSCERKHALRLEEEQLSTFYFDAVDRYFPKMAAAAFVGLIAVVVWV